MYKIVFVCTGNTCRSPMAEALAGLIFEQHNIDVSVCSAGVSAGDGYPASKNAIAAMHSEGIDLRTHKSTQVTEQLLSGANLILTMTSTHLNIVKSICPQSNAFTLSEYAMSDGDVSDPFGGSLEVYNDCAAQIKELIMASVPRLQKDFNIIP